MINTDSYKYKISDALYTLMGRTLVPDQDVVTCEIFVAVNDAIYIEYGLY